jgi:dihydrofolate reductase
VTKLKQQPGQDILMYSSVDLMHTLMRANMIDEYRLWLHPLVLGRGKRLFGEGDRTDLKLVEATTLPKGVVVLAYQPAVAPAAD